MVVGVIGLGLIGGSLALSLKARGFASKIIGLDKNPSHCSQALKMGIIDQSEDLEELKKQSDLIILAIPVDAAKFVLPQILENIREDQFVIDMGSTKKGICEIADIQANRGNFIASHPIAGTENAGPAAAFDGLYDGKITIICDQEKSNPKGVEVAKKLYETLKMRVLYMDSNEHDRHIAYVSHLSHITSFVLGQTVLEIEKDEKNIFNMAGSGFASTVRLAKSSPDMWAPIFEQNQDHLSSALDTYIKNLQNFKQKIEEGKKEDLHDLMSKVNEIRRVLEGI